MSAHPNPLRYARRAAHLKASAVREILKANESPQVISFAGGLPAAACFLPKSWRASVKWS